MKTGKQTLVFENRPKILNTASVVGPKESEGPLSIYFDKKFEKINKIVVRGTDFIRTPAMKIARQKNGTLKN